MIVLILIIVLAFGFDFINGFHDTANSIATAVSTRALTLKKAIFISAIMNFLGAVVSSSVAQTIAKDIIDINTLENGMLVIVAALISAITWNLITWYFGIPSSSSHALIGSMAGAGLADAGIHAIQWRGFGKIIESLIGSPVIALIVGFLMFSVFKLFFHSLPAGKANKGFRKIRIFTAALQAFSHGMNDAQKSMGIITLALVAFGLKSDMSIPHWVQFCCALSMALGTSVGGWRIIKTVGTQIMKLKPVNGVAADLSSVLVIQVATHLGLPVSTTHVVSSSIMGVGAATRFKGVKWCTGQRMLFAWVTTIPITIIISAGIFEVCNLFSEIF